MKSFKSFLFIMGLLSCSIKIVAGPLAVVGAGVGATVLAGAGYASLSAARQALGADDMKGLLAAGAGISFVSGVAYATFVSSDSYKEPQAVSLVTHKKVFADKCLEVGVGALAAGATLFSSYYFLSKPSIISLIPGLCTVGFLVGYNFPQIYYSRAGDDVDKYLNYQSSPGFRALNACIGAGIAGVGSIAAIAVAKGGMLVARGGMWAMNNVLGVAR